MSADNFHSIAWMQDSNFGFSSTTAPDNLTNSFHLVINPHLNTSVSVMAGKASSKV
jgi:hypothetical protein